MSLSSLWWRVESVRTLSASLYKNLLDKAWEYSQISLGWHHFRLWLKGPCCVLYLVERPMRKPSYCGQLRYKVRYVDLAHWGRFIVIETCFITLKNGKCMFNGLEGLSTPDWARHWTIVSWMIEKNEGKSHLDSLPPPSKGKVAYHEGTRAISFLKLLE